MSTPLAVNPIYHLQREAHRAKRRAADTRTLLKHTQAKLERVEQENAELRAAAGLRVPLRSVRLAKVGT